LYLIVQKPFSLVIPPFLIPSSFPLPIAPASGLQLLGGLLAGVFFFFFFFFFSYLESILGAGCYDSFTLTFLPVGRPSVAALPWSDTFFTPPFFEPNFLILNTQGDASLLISLTFLSLTRLLVRRVDVFCSIRRV